MHAALQAPESPLEDDVPPAASAAPPELEEDDEEDDELLLDEDPPSEPTPGRCSSSSEPKEPHATPADPASAKTTHPMLRHSFTRRTVTE